MFIYLFFFFNPQNHYRYASANVMNHGVLPQNVDQQTQVKQPQHQSNPLPPNAHFQAIQSQIPCQQEQETTLNNTQQPQTNQPQLQNNVSNNINVCSSALDQTSVIPASHKTKKVMEKSRRERKTIARQASAPSTNTTMQQLAINNQSPMVKFFF